MSDYTEENILRLQNTDYHNHPYDTNNFVIVLEGIKMNEDFSLWDLIVVDGKWYGLETLRKPIPYIRLEDVLFLRKFFNTEREFEKCVSKLIRSSPIYETFISEDVQNRVPYRKLRNKSTNVCYDLSPIEFAENSCTELNSIKKILKDYEKLVGKKKGMIKGRRNIVYSVFGEIYGNTQGLDYLDVLPEIKEQIAFHQFKTPYVYKNTGIKELNDLFLYLFERNCSNDLLNDKLKILLVLDNIHDFGVDRENYNHNMFSVLCDDKDKSNCITKYLVQIIIEKLSVLLHDGRNEIYEDYEHYENLEKFLTVRDNLEKISEHLEDMKTFSSGWEKYLLFDMEKKLPYIQIRSFEDLQQKILQEEWKVSNDTVSRFETAMFRTIPEDKKIVLLSSIFDGYYGSNPYLENVDIDSCVGDKRMNNFRTGDDNPLKIKSIYNDNEDDIEYKFRDNTGNITIERTFPEKYGKGGKNSRGCCNDGKCCNTQKVPHTNIYTTDNCLPRCRYDRVDKFTRNCSTFLKSDHLSLVAQRSRQEIEKSNSLLRSANDIFNDDVSFFLTLKALGDYVQVLEVYESGDIVFFTQDSMQFLTGAFIGAKIVKGYKHHGTRDVPENYRYICANIFPESQKPFADQNDEPHLMSQEMAEAEEEPHLMSQESNDYVEPLPDVDIDDDVASLIYHDNTENEQILSNIQDNENLNTQKRNKKRHATPNKRK